MRDVFTASGLKHSKKSMALKEKKTPGRRRNFRWIVALKIQQGIACAVHKVRRRGNDLVPDVYIAHINSQNEFGLGPNKLFRGQRWYNLNRSSWQHQWSAALGAENDEKRLQFLETSFRKLVRKVPSQSEGTPSESSTESEQLLASLDTKDMRTSVMPELSARQCGAWCIQIICTLWKSIQQLGLQSI